MLVEFTIIGDFMAKQRARSTKSGIHYTPKETTIFMNYIRSEFLRQCGDVSFGDKPLTCTIKLYFKPSKAMESVDGYWLTRCCKKPDNDNSEKIIWDSLSGMLFNDDSQIVENYTTKNWSTKEYEYCEVSFQELNIWSIDKLKMRNKIDVLKQRLDEKVERCKEHPTKTLKTEIENIRLKIKEMKEKWDQMN